MKRTVFFVLLAAVIIGLAACSTAASQHEAAPSSTTSKTKADPQVSSKSSPSKSSSAKPRTIIVPTDLAGAQLSYAKKRLAELGFTNVVVAGGSVTEADPVASVPKAGEDTAPDSKVVLVGKPSTPPSAPLQRGTRADSSGADTAPGCGQRAVQAGQFNPQCDEYQGYLDPGTMAGRGPTSGEKQFQHGCEQGYIPQEKCNARPS